MKLLLDTHLLLWAAAGDPRLPIAVAELIEDANTELYFSVASLWEVAIKNALGRSDFSADPALLRRGLLDNDYREMCIAGTHAVAAASLPPLHRDPFDRMLAAQANAEGITLVTADAALAQYPGPIRTV